MLDGYAFLKHRKEYETSTVSKYSKYMKPFFPILGVDAHHQQGKEVRTVLVIHNAVVK